MDLGRWAFAEKHMPEVKRILGNLPAKVFFSLETADLKQDTEQAIDLVMDMGGGNLAVRVRRYSQTENAMKYGFDWSVRTKANGYKNEVAKLKEGYVRFYFLGFSADNNGKLACWWLLDVKKILEAGLLDRNWKRYDNRDGTAFMAIPVKDLETAGCVLAGSPVERPERKQYTGSFAYIGG